jgi:hypothetical protein
VSGFVDIEESRSGAINRGHHESAVQEVVAALAGAFRQQHTPVAGGAQQQAVFLPVIRTVLRTHWIVGTQSAKVDGLTKIPVDSVGSFYETAERAF